GAGAPDQAEALGDVALAPAQIRSIDREAQCVEARIDRAAEMVIAIGVVAAGVKLKNLQRLCRLLRRRLQLRQRPRTDHHPVAESTRRCANRAAAPRL